jgi:hypothetical protein
MGALSFAEEHCPKAAIKFYLSKGLTQEFVALAAKLEDWDCLSKVLIEHKNRQLWFDCFKQSYAPALFDSIITNSIHFADPESASALVKVLIDLDETERLVLLTEALLEENPKFKHSRSLQTLHLIHLIPQGDTLRVEKAIDQLESYSIDEVIRASVSANQPKLILRVLERFELWPAAFKTAFFVLEDISKSLHFAEKWNSSEAYTLIFQYYLLKEDALAALKYCSKMARLNFKASELLQLLKRKLLHQDMYNYLCQLRGKGFLAGDLERAMFDCLVALDRMAELEEFVSSASPASAADLGFALAEGKKYALAGEAFIRAGDFDRAVKCLFHTNNNFSKLFDCAMKSKTLK